MPRVARSRSADGATIAALLPPSSRIRRPNRDATTGATARPIRVEPVADTIATPSWAASAAPTSAPPCTTWLSPAGAPTSAAARASRASHASAVSGVLSDGFQITGSPATSARAAFHDHTATGKLNAVMTAHGPIGCHVSISRWPGRSLAIVRPCSWRDSPTAKSQMSIISWTSPRPSERILPASIDTSAPRSSLCSRSSSPRRRTRLPRTGAGVVRHVGERVGRHVDGARRRRRRGRPAPSEPPVIGVRAARSPSGAAAPHAARIDAGPVGELVRGGQRSCRTHRARRGRRRGCRARRRPARSSRRAAAPCGSTVRRTSARAGRARSTPARAPSAVSWSGRSMPIIRPRPRTWVISGCVACSARSAVEQVGADGGRVGGEPVLDEVERRASPRRTPTGLPPNVEP